MSRLTEAFIIMNSFAEVYIDKHFSRRKIALVNSTVHYYSGDVVAQ